MKKEASAKNLAEKEKLTEGRIDKADVSWSADLFWAVSDVYNLEKHLYYTIWTMKGKKKEEYARLLVETRKRRAELMRMLIQKKKLTAAEWCQFKHIIGIATQLCEVAVKDFHMGNFERGFRLLDHAQFWFNVFFMISREETDNQGKGE